MHTRMRICTYTFVKQKFMNKLKRLLRKKKYGPEMSINSIIYFIFTK